MSDELVKPISLAELESIREKQTAPKPDPLAAIVERVHRKALRAAEKALLEPGEWGYTVDNERPWQEASIRVRAGLMLAAKAMDHARETDVGHRQFGLLVLRERFKDAREWESHARKVDAGTTTTATIGAVPIVEAVEEPAELARSTQPLGTVGDVKK